MTKERFIQEATIAAIGSGRSGKEASVIAHEAFKSLDLMGVQFESEFRYDLCYAFDSLQSEGGFAVQFNQSTPLRIKNYEF